MEEPAPINYYLPTGVQSARRNLARRAKRRGIPGGRVDPNSQGYQNVLDRMEKALRELPEHFPEYD